MFETTCPVPGCPAGQVSYCYNCDLFADLECLHVIEVQRPSIRSASVVTVESASTVTGRPECGILAASTGQRDLELIDAPV